jgi:hypothetical protein
MTENYLYNLSKPDIESLIDTLDTDGVNNTQGYSYIPLVASNKGNEYSEVVDARARLAALNNKEALDELSERVAEIEESIRKPTSFTPAGKIFVKDYNLMDFSGTVARGNGYVAYISKRIYYSRDGEKFDEIDERDPESLAKITAVGFNWDQRLFNHGTIAFTDNAFFLYGPSYNTLVYTTDFKTFTKVEGLPEDAAFMFLIENESSTKLIASDRRVFSLSKSGVTLLGTSNISPNINYLDFDEVAVKFNGNYYAINSGKLYKSEDFINFTEVPITASGKSVSDILRFFIIHDSTDTLFVTSYSRAVFTTDGETWTDVVMPSLYEDMDVYCKFPIDIRQINDNGSRAYYAILHGDNGILANGIFKWTSLTQEPTCIYHMRYNKTNGICTTLDSNTIKEVNNHIYFIERLDTAGSNTLSVFEIGPKGLTIVALLDLPTTSIGLQKLSYTATYQSQPGVGTIFAINDNLYITNGNGCNYKQIKVYQPGVN